MASWTDNVGIMGSFNPYIQTLNTEDLVTVGMEKQREFEQGVSQVQGYVNSLSSLPIAKKEVQNYVQQKLGQLREGVTKNLAGDFSDQRVVNQIGGAAKTISRDPIVQNGVTSTNRMQTALSQLDDAKKTGKGYGVENEWALQNSVSNWLNDGRVDSEFSGGYTPYVDVTGEAIKLYKDMHPGEDINQDAFRVGANGQLEVNPTLSEGVSPARIQNVLNLVMQRPDVQNQLNITGQYRYRGMDTNSMGQYLASQTNNSLRDIQDTIRGLQLKLSTSSSSSASAITQQIEQLKAQADQMKKGFEGNIETLKTNPDAIKSALVSQEIRDNFTKAYAYDSLKKNPLWDAQMDVSKFELDKEKFAYQQLHDKEMLDWDKAKTYAEIQAKLSAKGKTDANGNPIDDGGDVLVTNGNINTKAGNLGIYTFDKLHDDTIDRLNQAMYRLVFQRVNNTDLGQSTVNPIKLNPDGSYSFNVDETGRSGYKSIDEARAMYRSLYANMRAQTTQPDADAALQKSFTETVDPLIRNVRFLDEQKKLLDTEKETYLNTLRGKMDVKNPDYIDAYIAKHQLPGWQDAEARLSNKYRDVQPIGGNKNWEVGLGIHSGNFGDVGGQYKGQNYNEFQKFSNSFDNTLAPKFQEIEDKYKQRQQAYLPTMFTQLAPKDADKEALWAMYSGMVNTVNSGEGDIQYANKDFREALGDKLGAKNKVYGGYHDRYSGKYVLTVKEGKAPPVEMEVNKEEFEKIPGFKARTEFFDKFGDDLALTQNTTTDVPIESSNGTWKPGGVNTAYRIDNPPSSKYDVRYHVVGDGQNSWSLKMYVYDKASKKLILGGVDAGLNTNQSGILSALEQFKNDAIVEALIASKSGK